MSELITLSYGGDAPASLTIEPSRVLGMHRGPAPVSELSQHIRGLLENPPGYPPLSRCVVPGDRVALIMDEETLQAPVFLSEILQALSKGGVQVQDVTLITSQPLSADLRANVHASFPGLSIQSHDVTDGVPHVADCTYLASSACGQRIYLSRPVIDADFVVSCGLMTYHHQTGYRTTSTMVYPELSDQPTQTRYQAWGLDELRPEDDRGWRQLATEVDWLIGSPFSIQAIPSLGGSFADVSVGQQEQTYAQLQSELDASWRYSQSKRCDIAICVVDLVEDVCQWKHIAEAIRNGRKLVQRDGKIVLLTSLKAPLTEQLQILLREDSPYEAFQNLRGLPAHQHVREALILAEALEWASIYLLSQLPADQVEDLFMTPLSKAAELQRLLDAHPDATVTILPSAQFTYADVSDDE